MRKSIITLVAILGLAMTSHALDVRETQNFINNVNFEGPIAIDGTTLTATAAELNRVDGGMSASNLIAGDIPLTAGAINLGTNVSLQAVQIPASGGALALGTNVTLTGSKINSPSFPAAGGAFTLGTNAAVGGGLNINAVTESAITQMIVAAYIPVTYNGTNYTIKLHNTTGP